MLNECFRKKLKIYSKVFKKKDPKPRFEPKTCHIESAKIDHLATVSDKYLGSIYVRLD